MVTVPKPEDIKKPDEPVNNSVIMESSQVKPEDVVVEHEASSDVVAPRKQKDDPLAEIRAQQASTEKALNDEKERRIAAEHERDIARTQVDTTKASLAKSENEKVATQEAAILSRVETAQAEVENAERALEEAIDTGKPAKEQISLQKRLAEAVYKMKGAEGAKAHFDNWKENQKNKPVTKAADDGMTPAARSWVDAHPRFNTDKKYKRVAVAAHEDAIEDGVSADSKEYFRRINLALSEAGFEEDGSATASSPTPTPPQKSSSGTSTAAPVSQNSTAAGASGGNAAEEQRQGRRVFKLDGEMRQMALKTYGKGTSFNLPDDEAFRRYAARQIEIRDKRKNGERV